MLFREWPSDRSRCFSIQVLGSPREVKFLDQICSQSRQVQCRQWVTLLPRSLSGERSSSIPSPSPKHSQPLWHAWPQCHWLQVTAFNLIQCLLCRTNRWCASAIKAGQWPGLKFMAIINLPLSGIYLSPGFFPMMHKASVWVKVCVINSKCMIFDLISKNP